MTRAQERSSPYREKRVVQHFFESDHKELRDSKLTSWCHTRHQPQTFVPRALRKLAVARGFMVYEGLR
jgi:hypothetical protein